MSGTFVIFGSTGQLASALRKKLTEENRSALFFNRVQCNFENPENIIKSTLSGIPKPRAIIIAAAYTAVDQAESEPKIAHTVNATSPAIIAQYCAQHDIPLVHISTDYVFNGRSKVPYLTQNQTDPQSIYGTSKLAGEINVIKAGGRAAILRTSWVFDGIRKNFLTTMLRLSETSREISIVADQIGRPTFAGHLADAVITIADALSNNYKDAQGLFHVTGSGDAVSWAEYADSIFDSAGQDNMIIHPISSEDYVTAAVRPTYSVLDLSRYESMFGTTLPDWRDGLREALRNRITG